MNKTASGVMVAQKPHEFQVSKFDSSLADKSKNHENKKI